MNVEKHRVYVDDELIELTYKEFELLRVFLSNAGNVMPRNLLMDRVWGTTFEGESRTLDMHIKTWALSLDERAGVSTCTKRIV